MLSLSSKQVVGTAAALPSSGENYCDDSINDSTWCPYAAAQGRSILDACLAKMRGAAIGYGLPGSRPPHSRSSSSL